MSGFEIARAEPSREAVDNFEEPEMRYLNLANSRAARLALTVTLMIGLLSTPLLSQEIGFENARIVDPATREINEGAIIVRNGVIVAVESALPSGFAGTRVDLEGRWVIPGLVDMHTHSFGNGAPGRCTSDHGRRRSGPGCPVCGCAGR